MTKHKKSKSNRPKKQTGGSMGLTGTDMQPEQPNIILYIIVGILIASVIGIVIYIIVDKTNKPEHDNPQQPKKQSNQAFQDIDDLVISASHPISYPNYIHRKAHERVINPALPPERSFEATYGIPINIPSRGFTESYQQIGMLYKNEIADADKTIGNNSESVIIPIYGKPLYPGSNKWNYYITSDKYNSVKMPFTFKNKKTDDQHGVEELVEGEVITLPEYNGEFVTKLYQYDSPKYIPYIV